MGSAFRDCAGEQIRRYFDQAAAYRDVLRSYGWDFRLIACEGDSGDNTRDELQQYARARGILLDLRICNVGGPRYGSVESPDRFQRLSRVGNCILEGVDERDDIMVYVESDLVWDPATLVSLGGTIENNPDVDVVAPYVFAGLNFYDVWGFRGLDGTRFAPFLPYHSSTRGTEMVEVSSVGSCLVMRGEVARSARIINDECLVGFCRDARAKGYRIWVDPKQRVRHL
jgi:hypothetical protein